MSGTAPDPVRLVVVSNRLPVVLHPAPGGGFVLRPGSGGLVAALGPVVRRHGGVWMGWPGAASVDEPGLARLLEAAARDVRCDLVPVGLSESEVTGFYHGFANQVLWPLFHDLQSHCRFDSADWESYRSVNRKYAQAIARMASSTDLVWVHDYHLMTVGAELRALGLANRLGYFLHIPFPAPDLFRKLPWARALMDALVQYDLLGFQTAHDRNNFARCLECLSPAVDIVGSGRVLVARTAQGETRLGCFPIGIDFDELAQLAERETVQQRARTIREEAGADSLVVGVDRLDYTKGIPHRLRALRLLLQMRPDLRGHLTLLQVVIPSRLNVPHYQQLKNEIERLVGQINGAYAKGAWVPVRYHFRSIDRHELAALYAAGDAALITPLRDGMNLVSKEYCACNVSEQGTLILSELAGAAAQLNTGALLVNPFDCDGVARAIERAVGMPSSERGERMARLRRRIREADVYWWADVFVEAATAAVADPDAVVEERREDEPPAWRRQAAVHDVAQSPGSQTSVHAP